MNIHNAIVIVEVKIQGPKTEAASLPFLGFGPMTWVKDSLSESGIPSWSLVLVAVATAQRLTWPHICQLTNRAWDNKWIIYIRKRDGSKASWITALDKDRVRHGPLSLTFSRLLAGSLYYAASDYLIGHHCLRQNALEWEESEINNFWYIYIYIYK